MKNILKFKILSGIIFGSIFILIGAYSFATGNKETAKSLFTFGLISTLAGLLWIFTSKKYNKTNHS